MSERTTGEAGDAAAADHVIEAEADTLGEAKWAAVKALERRLPGLDSDDVSFEVLDDASPVRVRAEADLAAWSTHSSALPEEPADRVRQLVSRVVGDLELRASVDVSEDEEQIRAVVHGEDLGLLIGRHGTTIDALQHLATRAAFRGSVEHKRVVIDAAGYRERREAQLRRAADRAAEDALSFGRPVEMEPMAAHERKAVHHYLLERTDVDTHSEGDDPERRLVVSPIAPRS